MTRKRVKHEKYIFLIGCISSSLDCFSITKKLHESFPERQTLRDNFLINDIGDAQFLPQTQICKFDRTKFNRPCHGFRRHLDE